MFSTVCKSDIGLSVFSAEGQTLLIKNMKEWDWNTLFFFYWLDVSDVSDVSNFSKATALKNKKNQSDLNKHWYENVDDQQYTFGVVN